MLPIFIEDVTAPDSFLYYLSVHQSIRVGDPGWRDRFFCALEALEKGRRRWWNTTDPRSHGPPPLVATA
jgi:hypothetical protein